MVPDSHLATVNITEVNWIVKKNSEEKSFNKYKVKSFY